jgi:hypothetical protein
LASPTRRSSDVTIAAATDVDLPGVARLADVIWRAHYRASSRRADRHARAGYCSTRSRSSCTNRGGLAIARRAASRSASRVVPAGRASTTVDSSTCCRRSTAAARGALIAHVEAAARGDGARTLILNVNKRTAKAIAAYRACGFATREAVVADIGGGFVMDDYVMAKAIGPG